MNKLNEKAQEKGKCQIVQKEENMKKRQMKSIIFMLIGVIALVGSISFLNVRADAKKNTGKTFTVGFDAEFPPYGYKDSNGEYVGFDLDLAQEVCDRKGWTLKKQPIDWDSKDMELNSNTIDCIWNGFTMNGREDMYTWSDAYVDNSQVVLVNKGSDIKKLSDLAGKVVVVQADSSAKAALVGDDATEENKKLAESFAEMQEVSDYNSAVMNLESGAVDAICMDIGVAKFQQGKHEDLTILDETLSSEGYGIGFRKGNTKLRDEVQETLYEMVDDGTFAKIAEKYKDYNLPECICLSRDNQKKDTVNEKEDTSSGVTSTETAKPQSKDTSKETKSGFAMIQDIMLQLLEGFGSTLAIFLLTLLFSLPLGLLIAFGRMSKIRPIQWIMKFYISIMRGTPLMLQLFIVFFGPYYVFNINLASLGRHYRFIAVIIGFALNYAAYFAEIYRGGIENIPSGQREAAKLLGYTRGQTFCKIIFPQMVKRVMPPVTNEIITLVKDTSLAFVLGYTEMFRLAKEIAANLTNIMPLFIAGVFYYVFNYVVAYIMERIEKKLDYFE